MDSRKIDCFSFDEKDTAITVDDIDLDQIKHIPTQVANEYALYKQIRNPCFDGNISVPFSLLQPSTRQAIVEDVERNIRRTIGNSVSLSKCCTHECKELVQKPAKRCHTCWKVVDRLVRADLYEDDPESDKPICMAYDLGERCSSRAQCLSEDAYENNTWTTHLCWRHRDRHERLQNLFQSAYEDILHQRQCKEKSEEQIDVPEDAQVPSPTASPEPIVEEDDDNEGEEDDDNEEYDVQAKKRQRTQQVLWSLSSEIKI
jgi:hypothetical protein